MYQENQWCAGGKAGRRDQQSPKQSGRNAQVIWKGSAKKATILPLPTFFFNTNFFRCSNFTELRSLLHVFKHKHVHPNWRIQVIWKGSAKKGTIDRLSIVVPSLKKLRLIFDERTEETTLETQGIFERI